MKYVQQSVGPINQRKRAATHFSGNLRRKIDNIMRMNINQSIIILCDLTEQAAIQRMRNEGVIEHQLHVNVKYIVLMW